MQANLDALAMSGIQRHWLEQELEERRAAEAFEEQLTVGDVELLLRLDEAFAS